MYMDSKWKSRGTKTEASSTVFFPPKATNTVESFPRKVWKPLSPFYRAFLR